MLKTYYCIYRKDDNGVYRLLEYNIFSWKINEIASKFDEKEIERCLILSQTVYSEKDIPQTLEN